MDTTTAISAVRDAQETRQDDEWNWRLESSCSSVSPELFFARPSNLKKMAEAKAICASCPVLEQCREYALDPAHFEFTQYGLWAGMTERERRALA